MAEKPTSTSAETLSQTEVRVTWTDSADGLQYLVYLSQTDFAGAILAGAAAMGAQECVIRGLAPGATYRFYVLAIAADGTQSEPDGPAEATTLPLLAAPEGFYVEARGSSSLWLTWAEVEGVDLYLIYINDGDDFASARLIEAVAQGRHAASIDSLVPEHEYYLWIVARAGENLGNPSDGVQVITLPAASGGLDLDAIRNALYAWADGVIANAGLSIPAIWANENGPRPQGPHVQLSLAGPNMPDSFDSIAPAAGGGQTFEQRGLRSFLVSGNVYSPVNAASLACQLQASLSNPILRAPLENANIGIGRISDVRDLSAFLETRWEKRSQLDFVIFATLRGEVVQDLIEDVKIKNITPA